MCVCVKVNEKERGGERKRERERFTVKILRAALKYDVLIRLAYKPFLKRLVFVM